jgi:hypothetical protein
LKTLLTLTALFAMTLSAADIAGTWKGTLDTPNGPVEGVITLKTDGDKLTGTAAMGPIPETAISEAKLDGDNVSFVVAASLNGNDLRLVYKGKVSADEIKFTIEVPGREQSFQFNAKRSS